MRHSPRTALIPFVMTIAISLVGHSNVQAGNGWEWQKPINQRLGAFYTLNKAFKQPKSTSRTYRRASSYPSYTVTPTYPALPVQTKTVEPMPIRQVHVQGQPIIGQIQSMPVQTQSSATPVTVVSGVSPKTQSTKPITRGQAVENTTRIAADRALELLGMEPAVGIETPITTTPAPTVSKGAISKGAVRMVSPSSPSTAEPITSELTTDLFWK